MCSTSAHCVCVLVCVCVCVCVCVACLPVPYVLAQPKFPIDTCCTCMASDSSQTRLTITALRFPGCSDWKPQDICAVVWTAHEPPHFLLRKGALPLTFMGGGGG